MDDNQHTNWTATYYDIKNNIISSHEITDRTENEAESEAIADLPYHCEDWSLMPEGFLTESVEA